MAFRHSFSVGRVARDTTCKGAKMAYNAMIFDIIAKSKQTKKQSKQTKK